MIDSITPSKSKIITLLLCIFLGYLGIHRFYTGYAWFGVLYLLTGGILGIGILVDLIFIIFGGYEDVDGNSLK
jgi:TM2 domain-containing membrane protein YozV